MNEINDLSILTDSGAVISHHNSAKGFAHSRYLFTSVLGMNSKRLNVRVEVKGDNDPSNEQPNQMEILVYTRPPGNKSVKGIPIKMQLRKAGKSTYTGSFPMAQVSHRLPFNSAAEVATVVREHGTSDAKFRTPLFSSGWESRGVGIQPDRGKPNVTGNAQREQMDALTLLKAGGVEVIEVSIPEQKSFESKSRLRAWAFMRNPADIVFYSGHGAWWNGNLLRGTVFGHTYDNWISPEELLSAWSTKSGLRQSPSDIDILIINGCSVLFWNHKNEKTDDDDRKSYGLKWARLLGVKQGPLAALLGYRYTAPLDYSFGNKIASEIAHASKSLGANWFDYAKRWMEINAKYQATWTASAFDHQGYWYINLPTKVGFDPAKKPGAIMGPIALP